MDNNLFIKNILILIFFIILIHIFLNNFLLKSFNKNNNKNNINNINNTEQNNKIIIYFFYADWCTHCKYYKPIFKEFKNKIKDDSNIDVFEINADVNENGNINKELYDKYNIEGFPTTIIIKNNIITKLVGKKSINELALIVYGNSVKFKNNIELLENNTEQYNTEQYNTEQYNTEQYNTEQNNIEQNNIEQNNIEQNNIEQFQNTIEPLQNNTEQFRNTIKPLQNNTEQNNKIIIYFFYADWCTHCKYYKPIFKEFKNKIKDDSNIDVFEINADVNENGNINKELYDKYNIEGFPTTIIIKNNIITKLVGKKSINELALIVYGNSVKFKNNNEPLENNNEPYNTEQYNTEQYNTEPLEYNTEQYNTEPLEYNTEQFRNTIKPLQNNTEQNNTEQNNTEQNNTIKIYLFYQEGCKFCKIYQPNFRMFKDRIINNNNIIIYEINAKDNNKELESKYNIEGYPTTIISDGNSIKKLVGPQKMEDLLNIIKDIENFGNTNNTNEIVVYNFNTSWCKYSKLFQPEWEQFNDIIKNYKNIKSVDIKCDKDNNINFCNSFNITSVPSIVISLNNELKTYSGPRTLDGLMKELNLNYKKPKVNNNMTKVYNFNLKNCKYAMEFNPEWNTFINSIKSSDNIQVFNINCNDKKNKDLLKKYNINRSPCIMIENNNKINFYNGERTARSLKSYLRSYLKLY